MNNIILLILLTLTGCVAGQTRTEMFSDIECRHEMDKVFASSPNTFENSLSSIQFYKDCLTIKKQKNIQQ